MKQGLSDAAGDPRRAGQIDYRLARLNVLTAFRSGDLSTAQVCDAQSELSRNARHCGVAVDERCPICDAEALRNVTYVFGPRLPSGGRCVTSLAELNRLSRRQATYVAYVVEVCVECAWNHLIRCYAL